MSTWVIGLYILISGGLALYSERERVRRQRVRLGAFQEAAKLCGLRVGSISSPSEIPVYLEARADAVTMRIEGIPGQNRKFSVRVLVTFPGPPGFLGVRIRSEAQRPAGAREIEVGDERFDSLFFVEGPARLLTVLLDAETRRLLATASSAGQLTIANGQVQVETFDPDLESLLPTLLALGRHFSEEVDVAQRLAENARQDSTAGVRLSNLLTLVREFPREPGTVETLRAACADSSPQIRLRAAMALGAEGRDVLVAVAESLEDDESSARAVAHLGQDLPFDRSRALLDHALRRRRIQTVRACLEAVGQSGDAAAVDVLEKVLTVEKGELAAAAARALGTTGSPAAEPALLRALRSEKMDLRLAAAIALGRAGSAAAVLPLKEASESSRDDETRRVIRQAIAEIQSRLQGATPGQLSLAGAEAGRLSLPEAEGGQLSLPPEEPGKHKT